MRKKRIEDENEFDEDHLFGIDDVDEEEEEDFQEDIFEDEEEDSKSAGDLTFRDIQEDEEDDEDQEVLR